MAAEGYRASVLGELVRHRLNNHADNFDTANLGVEPPPEPPVWRGGMARALAYYLTPRRYFAETAAEQIARGEFLYGVLGDQPSRDLLLKLIAFRVLGHRRVKLPLNKPGYWRTIEDINRLSTADELLPVKAMNTELAMKDLRPMGYDMRLYAGDGGLACLLVQRQYEYHQDPVHCRAEPGDIVLDCGTCWADTTLYFAHEVGPTGQVIGFEFIPSNLVIARRNLELNPDLAARIRIVEHPLWSSGGLRLHYLDGGPGSSVSDDASSRDNWDGSVDTVTIDETVARLGLPKVDFVKMDIEGAELDSLKGGEQTIRRYRPKLAISLYHRPDDFETIPRWLAGLDLGYKFYLDHHTIYQNETVLFGVPSR
jgi:FkbM family methyltransferase